MLLVRPVIASSANHVRAAFSPHATVLNTLYATEMLQQEVPCEQRCAGSFEYPCLKQAASRRKVDIDEIE